MSRSQDNLRRVSLRASLRTGLASLIGLSFLAATLAVPLARLRSTQALVVRGIDAELRLPRMRRDQLEFESLGGFPMLEELGRLAHSELPERLSRVDLHGALTALARNSGLELETLSVGEFAEVEIQRVDDAVAGCAIRLAAKGTPAGLMGLVRLLCELGYPTIVHSLQLVRDSLQTGTFNIQASLELFQSIQRTESSSEEPDTMELPN